MDKKVVTYQSTREFYDICESCAEKFKKLGEWPRDQWGEEFFSVYMGLHIGDCDACLDEEYKNVK